MAECPNCKSQSLARDPGSGLVLVSLLFFPFGLLLLLFTQNRYCMSCGIRFRIVQGSTNVTFGFLIVLLVIAALVGLSFFLFLRFSR
jgi:hypothetical protein